MPYASGSFANKVALVTGSSCGLGAAIGRLLASLGCSVMFHGRGSEKLRDLVESCVSEGVSKERLHYVTAELSDDKDCDRLLAETIQRFSKLDILVNNAGILNLGDSSIAMDAYDESMRINTRQAFYMSRLCIPHLEQTRGNIVNISSVMSEIPAARAVAYNMSKAAVDMMTKCLAQELAPKGIRVNGVLPSAVFTEIRIRHGVSYEQAKKEVESMTDLHPLGRLGTGDDIAKAVAFLADNDLSPWITGACVPVDGGRMCNSY